MELKRLDELAERFWEGTCTEAEEASLIEACSYGEVPERHHELRSYLKFLEESRSEKNLDEVFDLQVMQEIERRGTQTRGGGVQWFKIAAGIAVLLGLVFALRSLMGPNDAQVPNVDEMVIVDTYEDPEVAYREVKKALMLVGNKMNDGMSYSGKLNAFEQATEEIQKDKVQ